MKTLLFIAILFMATSVNAERLELTYGQYVDEFGVISGNKYTNEDIFAPWNDPITTPEKTNEYLYDRGERDSDYYWKP